MASRKSNPEFMTGVPELLILRLLTDREMYGYELVQEIEQATGSAIKLGEGVVYPILHSLEARAFLKARSKAINGRTRVYYTTTTAGRKRLSAMIGEWHRITTVVSKVVGGRKHASAAA
jgi:PadR family transcriptional regulator, regulatory protein PadR